MRLFEVEDNNNSRAKFAYLRALKAGRRIPDFEFDIEKNPYYAFLYSKDIIKNKNM